MSTWLFNDGNQKQPGRSARGNKVPIPTDRPVDDEPEEETAPGVRISKVSTKSPGRQPQKQNEKDERQVEHSAQQGQGPGGGAEESQTSEREVETGSSTAQSKSLNSSSCSFHCDDEFRLLIPTIVEPDHIVQPVLLVVSNGERQLFF